MLRSFLSNVLEYLMPFRCLACSEFLQLHSGLCARCWNKLTFIRDMCCARCGRFSRYAGVICAPCVKTPPAYDLARSLLCFTDVSRKLVHDLKYHDRTDIASFFAELIMPSYKTLLQACDIVLPVPLHRFKLIKRSYNQAHILAKALAKMANVRYDPFVLQKSKFTVSQVAFSKQERSLQLKGSFAIDPYRKEIIFGKKVLLVDDVMTTGSTVEECAKLLKAGGAKEVLVLTVASVN